MTSPTPMKRTLTAEEIALCAKLGLEYGFDDDDEDKHQFHHICWPYAAYEAPLCGSPRLWCQGGPITLGEKPYAMDYVDCDDCMRLLGFLMEERERWPERVLFAVMGRMAEAVRTLSDVRQAARGLLHEHTRTPEYLAAVEHAYPRTTPAELRAALDADQERHRKNATEYTERKDAARREEP